MITKTCLFCGESYSVGNYRKNISKYCSRKCKDESQKMIIGTKHQNWKGNSVGYGALHSWVERMLGTPNICKMCGNISRQRYEWSNISGEYKRDLKDWQRLCVLCHRQYDRKKAYYEHTCPYCEKNHSNRNPIGRYCSGTCWQRQWRRDNREKTREYGKKYYYRDLEKNREKAKWKQKEYRKLRMK